MEPEGELRRRILPAAASDTRARALVAPSTHAREIRRGRARERKIRCCRYMRDTGRASSATAVQGRARGKREEIGRWEEDDADKRGPLVSEKKRVEWGPLVTVSKKP